LPNPDQNAPLPGLPAGPEWLSSAPLPQQPEADDPAPFAPFQRLSTHQIYDSPWCGLRRDWIRLPNGREQDYHVFEVTNAVAVVPVTKSGEVLMLWQYRYTHGRSHWEIPAGRIHARELPEKAAERELLEETGHRAGRWTRLPGFFPTNGISAHYAHLYLAQDCERVADLNLDHSEQLSVRPIPLAEARRRLHSGTFADGFTALALFYALAALESE
jgi:ADP-ribose pyrophosphatase